MKKLILLACALALPSLAFAQSADAPARYMDAPQPIAQILDTPPPPAPSVSPTRAHVALLGRANLPPIAELAEPELRLGGYRINPRNNGPANSRIGWLNALSFQDVASRAVRAVALPAGFALHGAELVARRTPDRFPARRRRPGSNCGSPKSPAARRGG